MQLVHQTDTAIRQAIAEQLPQGYETAPCGFPLTVGDQEYYIMGNQLVTLEEYERQLSCAF